MNISLRSGWFRSASSSSRKFVARLKAYSRIGRTLPARNADSIPETSPPAARNPDVADTILRSEIASRAPMVMMFPSATVAPALTRSLRRRTPREA